ncbi:hypothetical protein JCM8202v2_005627 [Rhodotorula sphaerocarpa]
MPPHPPLSQSLPDLATSLDALDGFDDLPDRPPSPEPRAATSPSKEPDESRVNGWDAPAHRTDTFNGPPSYWSDALDDQSGPHRPEEGFRDSSNGTAGLYKQDWHDSPLEETPEDHARRERSPSVGSIHSAPELAGPPSPRSTLSERGGEPDAEGRVDTGSPTSPTFLPASSRRSRSSRSPRTLWDYLREEIFAVEIDGEEGSKSERVTNFLAVPRELEKIIVFGSFVCLDSFLYTFTILPLRALVALKHLVSNIAFNESQARRTGRPRRRLRLSHKCDLTKAAILLGTLVILHHITDASKMYHGVRGQDTVKLYVLFNVLEIADRLCCSFGQDLQDSLFSRHTFARRTDGTHPQVRPLVLFGLNLAYVVAHTLVLFYQLVTLNVAINSYSNAILTLLMSNQFVEIKGSVFKKFEKENLFQLTCADIVERFQLGIMLFVIAIRNLIFEISSAATSSSANFALPTMSLWLQAVPTLSLLRGIFSPAVVVLMSECLVDWLKHAFITKFNHLRPGVYGRFIDVLCKDLVAQGATVRNDQHFVDQSPYVARRLGFAALPLGCLVVRVISQAFEMLVDESPIDEAPASPSPSGLNFFDPLHSVPRFLATIDWSGRVAGWLTYGVLAFFGWIWIHFFSSLVALKLLIGINLRAFASERWATMTERVGEDRFNDRQRRKIGVTLREETAARAE